MLVLTRQSNESIVLGDPANPTAVITVVDLSRGKVRLGVTAAKEFPVHRKEISDQIMRQRGQK